MSTSASASTNPSQYPAHRGISRRQVAIICVSNIVACFDFLLFFYLGGVFSEAFFPDQNNPVIHNLQMLGIFTAGYLSRPLGGLLIGRYGDVYGRKQAFLVSMSFIAIATLMTAVLPTYAQAGVLAPLLFLFARILQGMAFGAYAPLGWVFVAEHVARHRLATYCSIVSASFVVGVLLSNLFFSVIEGYFTFRQFVEYAWRLPFVLGAVLGFVMLAFWHKLDETPAFIEQAPRSSYWAGIKHIKPSWQRFSSLFLAGVMTFIISSLFVVVVLILPELVALKFSINEVMLGYSHGLGLLFMVMGCVFYGLIADKTSTGRTLMFGSLIFMIQTWAFYSHLQNGSGNYVLVMYALLGFCSGIIGLCVAVMVQLFVTRNRLTAVSLIYNSVYAVVGGMLPFALFYATERLSFAPALYLAFVGLVGFLMGLYVLRLPGFAHASPTTNTALS